LASMSFLLRSVTFPWRPPCLDPIQLARYHSARTNAHNVSFEALGIERTVVRALGKAFPNVQTPTSAQAEFIPAILQGKDVLLKGETGTGKSVCCFLHTLKRDTHARAQRVFVGRLAWCWHCSARNERRETFRTL
jgi:superfamily II DNA/RNA helicase